MADDKGKKPPKDRRPRKKYSMPKLIVHGSILAITSKAWEAQALIL